MADCILCQNEYRKYQKDIDENPEFVHGEYRGIEYVIRLSNMANWCGYIDQRCENTIDPHGCWTGGLTHNNITMKGFDTSQSRDFNVGIYTQFRTILRCRRDYHHTFKTFDWVLNHIKDLIDSSFEESIN